MYLYKMNTVFYNNLFSDNQFHSLFLPVNNPYVGTINHAYTTAYIPPKTKEASTQTDPVDTMIIGEKIKKAYGKDYHVLLN